MRRYHVKNNGWSDIAYNLAVDNAGRIWDLRGLGHLSAANGDEDVNMKYLAIVALIGEGQKPTPEMLIGIRKAVRMCRIRYPRRCKEIVGHRDIRPEPTTCPGRRLYAEIGAGTFRVLGLRRLLKRLRKG